MNTKTKFYISLVDRRKYLESLKEKVLNFPYDGAKTDTQIIEGRILEIEKTIKDYLDN